MTTTDTKSIVCDEDTFIERFRPIINHIAPNAGFDFGYGGCLFEFSIYKLLIPARVSDRATVELSPYRAVYDTDDHY